MQTDESDSDLIQFASPKVTGGKAASSRYSDQENKENKYLLDSSFNGGAENTNGADLAPEIGRRTSADVSMATTMVPSKPSPALLSSITSLLDSTILENASATLNSSYYDSIISPLTPSVLEENTKPGGKNTTQQQQTPVSTRHQPRGETSGGKLNETNLDVVDFIEVNQDSLGVEQDQDFWLCDPKSTRQSKQSKQLQMYLRQQQQQQLQQQVLNEKKQNTSTTTTSTNGDKGQRVKNPYKWITEEFEDKNLDKVKRTLLVTLDDIAKGYSKPCGQAQLTTPEDACQQPRLFFRSPIPQRFHHSHVLLDLPYSKPDTNASSTTDSATPTEPAEP